MRPPVRLLIIALCGAAGYCAVSITVTPPATGLTTNAQASSGGGGQGARMLTGKLEESALVAEWDRLLAESGKTAEDFPKLYDKIKKLEDPYRRRAFRAAALADWAARDPKAALAYLRQKDKYMVTQFMREWLRRDPDAAVNALLADDKRTYDSVADLLGDIAKAAPGRLAEVCAQLPKSDSRWATAPQSAFATFAAKDLDTARAAAEALTGPWREQALAGVAKAWGEKDGTAALAWAQAMPPGEARDGALKAVLAGWGKENPLAALAHLDLAPPGGDEMYYASDTAAQVLRESAKKDWNATMEWLRQNPGKVGRSSLDGLQDAFSHRLNADPGATMRELLSGGVPALTGVFGNAILNDGYAQHDAIWDWLQTQPRNAQTDELRGSLINAMTWKEPDVAMELLGKIPVTEENKALLDRAAQSLINGGSRSGQLDELLDKAPASIRPALLEYGLMYGRATIGLDGEHWAARLDELPADKRNNAVGGLARGWAGTDPEAAAKWALALPSDRERETAFGAVTSIWGTNDSEEAAQFLESLPQGGDRDRGTQHFANALAKEHPQEAWTWAQEIQETDLRLAAMQDVYRQLGAKNPAAAEELLHSAKLTPGEIATFGPPRGPGPGIPTTPPTAR